MEQPEPAAQLDFGDLLDGWEGFRGILTVRNRRRYFVRNELLWLQVQLFMQILCDGKLSL
jgi:hypothetical protein